MKEQELRIGNLVTINNELHVKLKGVIMEVVSIGLTPEVKNLAGTKYGVAVNVYSNKKRITEPDYSQFIRYIEPIEITEQLLIKLGFEQAYKSPIHSTCWIDDISYYIWHQKNSQYVEYKGLQVNCKYIHELQNLYFALTRKELKLKR